MSHKRKNQHAVVLGRKGGRKGGAARAASMTPAERSESARNAVMARWKKSEGPFDPSPRSLPQPALDPTAKTRAKFQALVTEWRHERAAMSSLTEIAMLPAYQKIIGMGADAVPLIIKQLRSEGEEPDQWFWALMAITDANPVKPEEQGDFGKMAESWLTWAEEQGYAG